MLGWVDDCFYSFDFFFFLRFWILSESFVTIVRLFLPWLFRGMANRFPDKQTRADCRDGLCFLASGCTGGGCGLTIMATLGIEANWWLYVVLFAALLILLAINLYVVVIWQHPDDKNEAYFPKAIVVRVALVNPPPSASVKRRVVYVLQCVQRGTGIPGPWNC